MSLIPLRFKDYPHDLCELHEEKRIGNFVLRKRQIPMGTELQFILRIWECADQFSRHRTK